ncbi:MAG: CAP domain-containing protein [Thermus sp.]|uniref:CAP domain-containing protein n=1 Tax=Thermus sp. TaxID=275 RepID=UPI003D0EA897
MRKTKVLLPLAALLLAACGNLSLPGLQRKPFTGALELSSPLQTAAPGEEVQVPVRATFNDPKAASVTLTVRLADPCAKGTSNCPGWDASRYPGVAHPTGSYTLTPASPSATLTFRVDPGAPPQGPFKYELVLSGQAVEEVVPFYLKVFRSGETSAMEYWNFWRDYMGYPRVREDPEWSFRAWLHGRYLAMNEDKHPFAHDEDLSYPFSSLEGQAAGRIGNVSEGYKVVPSSTPAEQVPWPVESRPFNGWVAVPFHRLNVISPPTSAGGFGVYRDRVPYSGGWDLLRSVSNLPVSESNNPNPTSGFQLFPVPDKVVPVNPTYYYEWPSPVEPCADPSQNPDPPYLSQTGLDWSQQPYGLPLSISMFAPGPNDTRVLQARLVRLSDGRELPVCGYGSLQFWNQDAFERDWGKSILKGYSTVFVVPRYPLDPGEAYRAEVRAVFGGTEKSFTWSFRVAPQDGLFPLRFSP